MSVKPRKSRLPLVYFVCLVATSSIPHVAAAFDWISFPNCAQPLLEQYAPDACDFGVTNGYELNHTNACLCSNTTFLIQSAVAIYIECGCIDLSQTANQLVNNCNDLTDTPLNYTVDQFIAVGDGNQPSCTQFESSSTDQNPASQGSSGSKTDLIVGLAVGIPAGILTLLALLVAILQLLVAQRVLPEGSSPWPTIRDSLRQWCCCRARRPRGSLQIANQGQGMIQGPVGVP